MCTPSFAPNLFRHRQRRRRRGGRRCRPKFKRHVLHALDEVEHWMSPATYLRRQAFPSLLSPCQSASARRSIQFSIYPSSGLLHSPSSLAWRPRVKPDPLPEVRRDSALAGGLSHRLAHQTSPTLRHLWRIATSGEGRRREEAFGSVVEKKLRRVSLYQILCMGCKQGPNPHLFNLRQLHGVTLSYE